MERIKVSKVEGVTLWRRGVKYDGTLHLTQHHIIFSYIPPSDPEQPPPANPTKPREVWITYPMIAFCTYRPAPPVSRLQPSIRLRCRDFTFVAFHFPGEKTAADAFETIRNLTCRLPRFEDLYAFSYKAQGPEKQVNGWTMYNPMQEFRRQGVGEKSKSRGWRITHINSDYQYSPTYPKLLVVPSSISDNVLNYAGRYRSRVRIPVLTYLHPVNDCSITRSSQPLVGVRQNRSVQDEKLVAAIFSTSKTALHTEDSFTSDGTDESKNRSTTGSDPPSLGTESSNQSLERMEDEAINSGRKASRDGSPESDGPKVYGATQHNLIVDARPTVNAIAMQAVGMGSENMDHYPFATKAYLGIDNIHVMRESLNKVVDAIKDGDITPLSPNRETLAKSNWLKHIANVLDGAGLIARQVGLHHSHVLIHCSDGWDRTSQLSALSQLCLDPYFRTIDGFIVLVEKDFLSFGHMFRHRSGFMGSEKWFDVENERIGGVGRQGAGEAPARGAGASNAFENALTSAKGFFSKHMNNLDRHAAGTDPDDDILHPVNGRSRTTSPAPRSSSTSTSTPTGTNPAPSTDDDPPKPPITKPKETSPVFHQFLDAVYQLQHQHPTRFEFNERFLRRLLYHLFSCQYGTFLFDSEKARRDAAVAHRTRSVWDYFLARRAQFVNPLFEPAVDDTVRGRERLLFPDVAAVRWWAEVFGRGDDEMNRPVYFGAAGAPAAQSDVSGEGEADVSALESVVSADVPETPQRRAEVDVATADATPVPSLPAERVRTTSSTAAGAGPGAGAGAFPATRIGAAGNTGSLAAGLAGMGLGQHQDMHPDERRKQAAATTTTVGP